MTARGKGAAPETYNEITSTLIISSTEQPFSFAYYPSTHKEPATVKSHFTLQPFEDKAERDKDEDVRIVGV